MADADGSGNNIVNTYLTKAAGVTNVAWDNANKKLTKTINGSSTDIVTVTVNNPTLAWNTESTIAQIGTVDVKVKLPANPNTNTATAADNILDGSNSGTEITYAPYSSQQSRLSFDTSSTNPTKTDRLNLNGYLYATKLYSGGAEVLTSHQSLANYKTKQTAITDSTGTSESSTATRFIYSISQDTNGEISVKTRPLPEYNNYVLPLAASGTRGGIQIGYTQSGQNYPVQLSSEKAYVNVPWTDTSVTAVGNHYTPSADNNALLTASISSSNTSNYAFNTEYTVLTGATLQRDAKGHVTGIGVTAQNVKDTWRGIQDNLTSESTTDSLSANQGRLLNLKLEGWLSAQDAMVFKGVVSNPQPSPNPNNIPADVPVAGTGYSAGWVYRVMTSGLYLNSTNYCEAGDIIIAIHDDAGTGSGVVSSDWIIIEHNIDGALYKTSAASFTGSKILLSNGTSGLVKELSSATGWSTWTDSSGGATGPVANIIDNSQTLYSFPPIPSAAINASGIVTTGSQSFSGDKSFQGNVLPYTDNSYTLGESANRWQKLYIGTADGYGDPYTPVYWNDGVPAAVSPVQKVEFTINATKRGVVIKHEAFNALSYVLQIVINDTTDANFPDDVLVWSSANPQTGETKGSITLQFLDSNTTVPTGQTISGYILVARGTTLTIPNNDYQDIT